MTGVISDIGNYRNLNEDSVGYFEEEDFRVYAIADGMGGHLAGEVASKLAIDGFLTFFKRKENRMDIASSLEEAIKRVNTLIYEKSLGNEKYNGMGTTITACVISDKMMYVGHVGDSSCMVIYKDMSIAKLTKDHSYAQKLVDCGVITEEEKNKCVNKNIITRAVGTDFDVVVDIMKVNIENIFKVILCSDGLTNGVTPYDILDKAGKMCEIEACKDLVDLSKNNGSKDNISIMIFKGAE
ncbi:protein phosphatase [Hathewaya proteolytica DSM 3090]|uniref:Protein phosphatase n=1 Tax=Hathewaya proteolytica DSM 3090 TaxID=1121331 RepID=A0A1M6JAF5_9CLOT|nr:Stp1/IreP family PP2C-type Ser/Thr phosphatase [Hathewaya proteolytica]SHJ43632.1 protein phosphatase [Hathewaya proteolytica DSM 3090]